MVTHVVTINQHLQSSQVVGVLPSLREGREWAMKKLEEIANSSPGGAAMVSTGEVYAVVESWDETNWMGEEVINVR